ncbi:MAG TPA: alpha/beta hydrolase [Euzebyales bacterium]|nr:alpha/beta hydrolase [Euzebyales bacterium]
MRRSLLGAAALTAGGVGGAVLGYFAERTVIEPVSEPTSAALPKVETSMVTTPDGTRLAVSASGPADAPRIVLVHGLSLAQEIWTAQRGALETTYRVVTFDMRGHGASDDAAAGDYDAAAIGSDVTAVLDAERDHPCIVVGHSMGGMALLAALGDRPDLVGDQVVGVVLVNTAAAAVVSGLGGGSVAAGIAFLRERARSSLLGRMVYGGLDAEGNPRGNDLTTVVTRLLGVGPSGREDAVETVRRLVLGSRPHVAGELWRTVGTFDQLAVAQALSVPALVIGGGRDRLLPVHHSRRLAETLPDVELVELPDVGHVAMLERPDEVSAALTAFARRVLTPASPSVTLLLPEHLRGAQASQDHERRNRGHERRRREQGGE